MSSMGLSTKTARCYDWYMDWLKCLDESSAPMLAMRKAECKVWLEDYMECLHHEKERTRELVVERERRRQAAGPAHKPAAH